MLSDRWRAFVKDVTTFYAEEGLDARKLFKNINSILARSAKYSTLDEAA
jgi:hypothetical protein